MVILPVRVTLIRAGFFGPPADDLQDLLRLAFDDFTLWRRANKVSCSQRRFKLSNVDARGHGSYLASKAWNARVLLQWLHDCMVSATTRDFDNTRVLGKWTQEEVMAGRLQWPTPESHPFLFLEAMASYLDLWSMDGHGV